MGVRPREWTFMPCLGSALVGLLYNVFGFAVTRDGSSAVFPLLEVDDLIVVLHTAVVQGLFDIIDFRDFLAHRLVGSRPPGLVLPQKVLLLLDGLAVDEILNAVAAEE